MTYTEEGEETEEQPLRDKLLSSVDSEALAYENYQNYNDAIFGTPEPPRALPSKEQLTTQQLTSKQNKQLTSKQNKQLTQHNGDLSDRFPISDIAFEDKIYTLEAMCDLDCGPQGTCLLERLEKDSLRKRCLCPLGKMGEKCAFGKWQMIANPYLRYRLA